MNISPSSLMSIARSAYKQSITDKKSVASFKCGFILLYSSYTDMGRSLIPFSTSGTKAKVLFLYEYNLFGNCIEHLAALNKIGNN